MAGSPDTTASLGLRVASLAEPSDSAMPVSGNVLLDVAAEPRPTQLSDILYPMRDPAKRPSDEEIAQALISVRGSLGAAAQFLSLERQYISNRVARSDLLKALRDEMRMTVVDTAEHHLFEAVDRGEAWAVRHILDRLGKDRGYTTKVETETGPVRKLAISWADGTQLIAEERE